MLAAIWDWAWGFFELQSVGVDVKEHARLIQKRVSVLIFMGLIGFLGCELRGCRDEGQINDVTIQGQNSAVLAQTYKAQLDAANNQIIQLKVDANEAARKSDANIVQITADKNAALQRVAQLESLPETAFLAYSNASDIYQSDEANFQILINGFPITNYIFGKAYVIPLKTNREIFIQILPLTEKEKPVNGLTVIFNSYLDITNIVSGIADGHWKLVSGNSSFSGKSSTAIQEVSQWTLTSEAGFSLTPIDISTQIAAQTFPAAIEIFAPTKRGIDKFIVNFQLT
jgi:16S rRNA G1207 methylase RsmC